MYQRLEKLDASRHAHLRRRRETSFSFAARVTAVPVAAAEFGDVARELPVVFLAADNPTPFVLMGLGPDTNAMVDARGRWLGTYVPASLRHYPFTLSQEDGKAMVAIDAAADAWIDDVWATEGDPVFSGIDTPSESTSHTINFMLTLAKSLDAARAVFKPLADAGLIVKRTLAVQPPSGEARAIGFFGVDLELLKAQPDSTLAGWVRDGTMALVHLHLASVANLQRLAAPTGAGEV